MAARCGGKRVIKFMVYLCEDTYRELIKLAPEIVGRHYGALSLVTEEALREYIARKRRELEAARKIEVSA